MSNSYLNKRQNDKQATQESKVLQGSIFGQNSIHASKTNRYSLLKDTHDNRSSSNDYFGLGNSRSHTSARPNSNKIEYIPKLNQRDQQRYDGKPNAADLLPRGRQINWTSNQTKNFQRIESKTESPNRLSFTGVLSFAKRLCNNLYDGVVKTIEQSLSMRDSSNQDFKLRKSLICPQENYLSEHGHRLINEYQPADEVSLSSNSDCPKNGYAHSELERCNIPKPSENQTQRDDSTDSFKRKRSSNHKHSEKVRSENDSEPKNKKIMKNQKTQTRKRQYSEMEEDSDSSIFSSEYFDSNTTTTSKKGKKLPFKDVLRQSIRRGKRDETVAEAKMINYYKKILQPIINSELQDIFESNDVIMKKKTLESLLKRLDSIEKLQTNIKGSIYDLKKSRESSVSHENYKLRSKASKSIANPEEAKESQSSGKNFVKNKTSKNKEISFPKTQANLNSKSSGSTNFSKISSNADATKYDKNKSAPTSKVSKEGENKIVDSKNCPSNTSLFANVSKLIQKSSVSKSKSDSKNEKKTDGKISNPENETEAKAKLTEKNAKKLSDISPSKKLTQGAINFMSKGKASPKRKSLASKLSTVEQEAKDKMNVEDQKIDEESICTTKSKPEMLKKTQNVDVSQTTDKKESKASNAFLSKPNSSKPVNLFSANLSKPNPPQNTSNSSFGFKPQQSDAKLQNSNIFNTGPQNVNSNNTNKDEAVDMECSDINTTRPNMQTFGQNNFGNSHQNIFGNNQQNSSRSFSNQNNPPATFSFGQNKDSNMGFSNQNEQNIFSGFRNQNQQQLTEQNMDKQRGQEAFFSNLGNTLSSNTNQTPKSLLSNNVAPNPFAQSNTSTIFGNSTQTSSATYSRNSGQNTSNSFTTPHYDIKKSNAWKAPMTFTMGTTSSKNNQSEEDDRLFKN